MRVLWFKLAAKCKGVKEVFLRGDISHFKLNVWLYFLRVEINKALIQNVKQKHLSQLADLKDVIYAF